MRILDMTSRAGAKPGQTVFELVGPLELQQVFGFQAKMREDESPVTIIDMTAVTYVDSAGIGALVNANISRQRRGRKFVIAGITERARTVLDVTKTSQFFEFYASAAEAEEKVQPAGAASA
jgi:anti-sigma B factor antagonist